ncbi:TetR/AcrR family transcriptional regulator [Pantoea sp. At-9b]|uniref:TetR/AcrR family transcriptional regulator n=1 Tax=Pantoea sp. (strain At-9b) TaxID=592316 RepID=UPI0001B3DE52|nr:TetR family transcriptional regulator [Pantoea sp. At-9b]ADU70303.1 transcriptional regulator, TetR family [Pantoea sp. At-9b]
MSGDGKRAVRAGGEQKREAILHHAAMIIRQEGLHACTHRAVAEACAISPGTVTYHFKNLDELHAAVIERAVESFTRQTRAWFCTMAASPVAQQLTQFLFWTLDERERLICEYALFVAAVSRPRLRQAAAAWIASHQHILQQQFALTTQQAEAAVAFTDAWLLRSIIEEGVKPDAAMVERFFASILQH